MKEVAYSHPGDCQSHFGCVLLELRPSGLWIQQPRTGNEHVAVTSQVILADTQAIFRAGITRVLSGEADLEVAAQCADLPALEKAVQSIRPALVLLSSGLAPELGPVLDHIEKAGSRAVLILEHGATADAAVHGRVAGLVQRSVDAAQLLDCLRRVVGGHRWVQPAEAASTPAPDHVGARVLERLTRRELQIIALVTAGAKNKDIASELGTKEQVVKNYLRAIYDKTGVSDRLELALFTVHHRVLAEAAEQSRNRPGD